MINVMMLINSFNLGGAEKLVYDLAKNMKWKEGIKVYICSMKGIDTELERTIKEQMESDDITCFGIEKKYKGDRIRAIFKIRKLIKEHKIDVLHTHGQAPDFYGRLATIGTKIKTVITVHSTSGYNRFIEMIQTCFTNQYTAVSNETKVYCENMLKIKKRVQVIENGIDFKRYTREQVQSKEFNILTIGRIDENKGYLEVLENIITFLKKHPDANWKIIGSYNQNEEYFQKFNTAINNSDVKDQIKVMGTTLHPEEEYKRANCFLLNSRHEGFGLAYIEAMAAELPILGNYVGVIQDIFKMGGKIGLISKLDINEYLEKIYHDGSFFESEIKQNKEIVEQLYSLTVCVDRYLNIYKQLVGEM